MPHRSLLLPARTIAILALALPAETAAQEPMRWSLVPDVRITPDSADRSLRAAMASTWPGLVAVSRAGEIAIGTATGVQIYSAAGRPIRRLGTSGAGPSASINFVGWAADSVWTLNPSATLTVYSPNGAVARETPLNTRLTLGSAARSRMPPRINGRPSALLPDGATIRHLTPGIDREDRRLGPAEPSWIARVRANGTVDLVMLSAPPDSSTLIYPFRGGYTWIDIPLRSGPIVAVAPDGGRAALVTTAFVGRDAGTFGITVVDSAAATLFARRYPFTPQPIPKSVVDSVIADNLRRSATSEHRKRAFETEVRPRMQASFPPVTGVMLGHDGTTWIALHASADGQPWLALGPNGDPIGRVVATRNVTIVAANRTHMWGVELAPDGVRSLVRYRLQPGR